MNREKGSASEIYWDKRSEIFDTQIFKTYEDAYDKTVRYTLKYLSKTDHALDIGCGTGVTTTKLAGGVSTMTAVDTSPEMLQKARQKAERERAENINFIRGDMFMEELKPGTFDAVMIFNVLLYVPEQAAAMRRLYGLLKPGGYLMVACDCLKYSFTKEALRKWYRSHTGKMPFVEFYTPRSLKRLVGSSGFEIVESEVLFQRPANYFLVGKKRRQQER